MSLIHDVQYLDSPQLDAFGRLKVSQPEALFDSMSEYGNNTFLWETTTTGSGTVTNVANQNAIRLSTGAVTNTNKAYRATRKYTRYQPGRSLNIEQTFVMSASQSNARARVGYFDASNGIFLERTGSTVNIVRRTNVTGTPTDTAVAQASWNVDTFGGAGPSGKTLDLTKTQILFIQLQYLGVGRVQVGFVIDGIPYVAHQFLNANSLSTVYMSTGCLPVRGEVENFGTAGGVVTLDMICTSVSSGGLGQEQILYARSNGITARNTSTTLLPLISIRAATLLGGTGGGGSITNRGHVQPQFYNVLVTAQIHEYQILLNPTIGGASWTANGTLSLADYDVSGSSVSGGTILDAGYIAAGAANKTGPGAGSNAFSSVQPLVYTALGSVQDTICLAVRSVTSTGTAYGAIQWIEEF